MNLANGLQLSNGADPGKVNITADTLVIQGVEHQNVSLVADLNVLGANGRDAGSETANSWWSVWVACDGAGLPASLIALLSLSASGPAVPGGETNKLRLGWMRNDANSNFYRIVNSAGHDLFWWNEDTTQPDFEKIDVSTSPTDFTDVICSTAAPETCRELMLSIRSNDASGLDRGVFIRNKDLGNTVAGLGTSIMAIKTLTGGALQRANTICGCDSSQTIQYRANKSTNDTKIQVMGYRDIRT
ncbi:hypothetical protein LCGC14_0450800 [marine sediment metagenome]|uniref:Uncharacterized protein n=1 Tax=marine sediment metagenome TaxID=412755 RepID=A0A0F9SN60_9ZZZZ